MGLEEYSSEATTFRIIPCYKHQKEGDSVVYVNDVISIACNHLNLNKIPYMRVSNPVSIKKKKDRNQSKEKSHLTPLNQNKTKIEINASIESQSKFKFHYYCNFSDTTDDDYLRCGDIIWLNHAELASSLVCITDFQDNFFKNRIEFDLNISDQFKQFDGNTNGMWIIEHEKLKEGGLVQWNEPYYLRHLSTGLYLGGKVIDKKDENSNGKIVIDSEISRNNLFRFVPILSTFSRVSPKNKKYVGRESFVLIQHINTKKILHGVFEKEQFLKKSELENESSSQAIRPSLVNFDIAYEEASIKLIKAN